VIIQEGVGGLDECDESDNESGSKVNEKAVDPALTFAAALNSLDTIRDTM